MEEFEEDYNDEAPSIQDTVEMEYKLAELKIRLAEENYNMIVDNGIDFKGMIAMGIDISPAISTINVMIDIFEKVEDYEKCAKLLKCKKLAEPFMNI